MSKGMAAEKARGNAAPNICTRNLRLPGGLQSSIFQGVAIQFMSGPLEERHKP
jgi:hypothetical protein